VCEREKVRRGGGCEGDKSSNYDDGNDGGRGVRGNKVSL